MSNQLGYTAGGVAISSVDLCATLGVKSEEASTMPTDFHPLGPDFVKDWTEMSTPNPVGEHFVDLSQFASGGAQNHMLQPDMGAADGTGQGADSGAMAKMHSQYARVPLIAKNEPQFDRSSANLQGASQGSHQLQQDLSFGGAPMFSTAGSGTAAAAQVLAAQNLRGGVFAMDAGFSFKKEKGTARRQKSFQTTADDDSVDTVSGDSGGDQLGKIGLGNSIISNIVAKTRGKKMKLPVDEAEGSSNEDEDLADSLDGMTAAQRRKRPLSKREPQPDEFSDDNEYSRAWTKWREDRDHNNKSVKRSRERAKIRKLQQEKSSKKRKQPNGKDSTRQGTSYNDDSTDETTNLLTEQLHQAERKVFVLSKLFRNPERMTAAEKKEAEAVLGIDVTPIPSTTVTQSGRKSTFKRKR